jgi:hypothetical protein
MAALQDCAALLEVGFGVSVVGAAAELYFKSARREIARQLYAKLRPADSHIAGSQAEADFERFVFQSSPGLRMARIIYLTLIALAAIALLVSVLGLVHAAIHPEHPVPDEAVRAYAVVSIVALPMLNWSYRRFLGWLQPAFAGKEMTVVQQEQYWRSFELALRVLDMRGETRALLDMARTLVRQAKRNRFRERLNRWGEKLRWPFA